MRTLTIAAALVTIVSIGATWLSSVGNASAADMAATISIADSADLAAMGADPCLPLGRELPALSLASESALSAFAPTPKALCDAICYEVCGYVPDHAGHWVWVCWEVCYTVCYPPWS